MSQIRLGKIIRVILQKKEGVYKVVNFKDFSRLNKDIKVFFKDLNRIQGLLKTTIKIQDLSKIARIMYNRNRKQRKTATVTRATKTTKKIVNRFNRQEKWCDVKLPWQKFWMTTMKSLSKEDGEINENGKRP